MTEREKMLLGKLYRSDGKELNEIAERQRTYCVEYNKLGQNETEKRNELINKIIPNCAETPYIQGPIYVDYGVNITIGKKFYSNYNLVILDCCPVTIGDNCMFGVNTTIVTPLHPLIASERIIRKDENDNLISGYEYAKPIKIGNNVWLASNVTIIGGVTIGDNVVIGAGSVVTKDIPSDSLAFGNPCRVIRKITEKDSVYLKKELL